MIRERYTSPAVTAENDALAASKAAAWANLDVHMASAAMSPWKFKDMHGFTYIVRAGFTNYWRPGGRVTIVKRIPPKDEGDAVLYSLQHDSPTPGSPAETIYLVGDQDDKAITSGGRRIDVLAPDESICEQIAPALFDAQFSDPLSGEAMRKLASAYGVLLPAAARGAASQA